MKYEDFQKFIEQNCCYETIYDDSEGRKILVIRMLDAYGMVNKAAEAERESILEMCKEGWWDGAGIRFHLEKRAEALTNLNQAAEDNGEPL